MTNLLCRLIFYIQLLIRTDEINNRQSGGTERMTSSMHTLKDAADSRGRGWVLPR